MKAKRIKRSSLPSFLTKLYEILENDEYHSIIHWADNGKSFIVQNLSEFIDKVLPFYFKHSNFASFVRQLNMYDFHKSRNDPSECSFYHKKFIQGKKHFLKIIKRKVNHFGNDNEEDSIAIPQQQTSKSDKVLDDILKRQNILEDKFNSLVSSSTDLIKEKEERASYEKNLQIILLLILAKYSKESNGESYKNNEETTILQNGLNNLDEDTINKLLDKSLEKSGLGIKDVQFSFLEIPSTNPSSNHITPNNKVFQLVNYDKTDEDVMNCLGHVRSMHPDHEHDKMMFNLTEEVGSVTQCLGSSLTMSPQQNRTNFINDFNDIEMFPIDDMNF